MSTENITQKTPDPLNWPRVAAGKQILEVKWSLLSEYLLSEWGLDIHAVLSALSPRKVITPAVLAEDGETVITPAVLEPAPARNIARLFELFAACVGHNYLQLGQEAPKASYWASVMDDGQFTPALQAMYVAMGKRLTQAKKQAPAPTVEIPTEPQTVVQ